ncbi:MAG: DNA-directed RNA polymerase [Nanoarchaeota archaeon]|nr:DNA-directed RNA polymerase [Nanoarchaeota archaeon]MBU1321576.1 DNA-directed RNA polymerase [Nanoarchaeota archaeon]MBU1598379.1 DNA-directed RNA polymerase [Nanoarchaeota archaeon]MBU2442132.1 DNA-directed RNA polymerase [Nanoarchaeota archaeon]
MFYTVKVKDHIRVPPDKFGEEIKLAIIGEIKNKYSGYISKDLGLVIDVSDIDDVGEGIIIPGDGASYYETTFNLITFEPEIQEVIRGKIKDIADFGVFFSMGPIDGMIHISQTMNDYVSFSKDKALQGKESKRNLKVGDKCRARIIAVSYKDIANPKLGLTMRQAGLGKDEWVEPDLAEGKGKVKKAAKPEDKKK